MPSLATLVQYHTSKLLSYTFFHCAPFEQGTDGATSIASRSEVRNRQTCRLVPDNGYAFTFPRRAQRRTVRTSTLRYRAASRAVSHSVAGTADTPSPGCEPDEASFGESAEVEEVCVRSQQPARPL